MRSWKSFQGLSTTLRGLPWDVVSGFSNNPWKDLCAQQCRRVISRAQLNSNGINFGRTFKCNIKVERRENLFISLLECLLLHNFYVILTPNVYGISKEYNVFSECLHLVVKRHDPICGENQRRDLEESRKVIKQEFRFNPFFVLISNLESLKNIRVVQTLRVLHLKLTT